VDDDVRRLIRRYGAADVTDALKRQTKPPRGRKPEKDWPELRSVIDQDAKCWLDGGDPFSSRSNYSIAKNFADQNPGHSHPATMKRIERKLAQKRVWMTLATAQNLSRDAYPYAAHLRAWIALSDLDPHPVWSSLRSDVERAIADFHAELGMMPPSHWSIKQVEDALRDARSKLRNTPVLTGTLWSNGVREDKSP